MIFLALLDAAMRYREGYFREDIEAYDIHLQASLMNAKLDDRGSLRRGKAKCDNMLIQFKNKQEEFNRIAYKKVEEIVEQMGVGFKNNFDNYATGFGILAEEFLKAKNTTELLTVCKLYNQGLMENTFAEIRKQRENEKEITITDGDNSHADDIIASVVQEGKSITESTTDPIDQSEQH